VAVHEAREETATSIEPQRGQLTTGDVRAIGVPVTAVVALKEDRPLVLGLRAGEVR
jgi:hypothetical protein